MTIQIKRTRMIDPYDRPGDHIYPHYKEWDEWDVREDQGAEIMVVDRDIPEHWKPGNAILLVIDRYGLETYYLAEVSE